ncbi:MAG TPA: hypothetical protein VGO03_21200 [Acidimicrobiia bacterium]|jgi:hypothetical protein
MTASDVVLVALAVLVAIGAGATVSMLVSLRSTLVSLRRSLDSLQQDTLPIVEELRDAVTTTTGHVERVDRLITGAESVEAHVDAASRLAYRTISSPVVKTVAFGSGVKKATQRLRRRRAS